MSSDKGRFTLGEIVSFILLALLAIPGALVLSPWYELSEQSEAPPVDKPVEYVVPSASAGEDYDFEEDDEDYQRYEDRSMTSEEVAEEVCGDFLADDPDYLCRYFGKKELTMICGELLRTCTVEVDWDEPEEH